MAAIRRAESGISIRERGVSMASEHVEALDFVGLLRPLPAIPARNFNRGSMGRTSLYWRCYWLTVMHIYSKVRIRR